MRRPMIGLFLLAVAACGDEPTVVEPASVTLPPQARKPFTAERIALGDSHACAIPRSGTPLCWGRNDEGQLGNGSNDDSPVPVPISGGHAFVEITAGGSFHTCALTAAGEAWCWGRNWFGELGDGTTTDSNVPVRAAPGLLFSNISAGTYQTCGVAIDGPTYCWGSNGAEIDPGRAFATETGLCPNPGAPYRGARWYCSPDPVEVPGAEFASVSSGIWATCGLTSSGSAFCTGWNGLWQLGNGTADPTSELTPVAQPVPFHALSLGAAVACALSGTDAWCWGGQFFSGAATGDGSASGASTPTAVAGGLAFQSVETSDANNIYAHACGIVDGGAAWCWGVNREGALGTAAPLEPCGNPQYQCATVPVPVEGGRAFSQLALGNGFTCGIEARGQVYCWGKNDAGQVGDGTTENRPTPVAVRGVVGNPGMRPTMAPPPRSRAESSSLIGGG